MGKLVLTRKEGEQVRVGANVITLHRVSRANVNIVTTIPKRVHSCAIGDTVQLEPGVTVTVVAIRCQQVKLAFEAPLSVQIVRTEIDV